ncbi:DUF4444 domain-containing protein [Thalassococcus sp. BH17M4-6]|uniref:biotin/lipoate--protein ligase family protein n=1 Tax=Thalassococcus sp. BH17M4-6 TaxID=3413148 RepID=UPI003BDE4667
MTAAPQFPPLLQGRHTAGQVPFIAACAAARDGCDAGLILYDASADLAAAMVLAPEVPLAKAAAMLPLAEVGLQNALGALAPPELPVQMDWTGGIRVNAGLCGHFRIAAAPTDPDRVPDWLVVGFDLRFLPGPDAPGSTPDTTALYAEGCGDLAPADLLEAWARHTLAWLHRWEEEGMAPLHREWSGIVIGIGQPITVAGARGTFLGLDEHLGLLLKTQGTTRAIPLHALLEDRT